MAKTKTFIGVTMCQTLFGPCEELAKALQAVNTTATGAMRAANVLLTHLRKLRDEHEFDHLYTQGQIDTSQFGLTVTTESDCQPHRQVRPPARNEMQPNTGSPHVFTEKEKMRSEYYAALDVLISEVECRFDQPALSHLTTLENILSTDEVSDDARKILRH